jgi:hypothetical protein
MRTSNNIAKPKSVYIDREKLLMFLFIFSEL